MGKFRKAAPGGRKGGTGKKAGGAKAGSRKPSRGVGRGKGQSKSFIPDRGKPVIGRGTKRKKATGSPKSSEREDKPFRSREGAAERSTERKSSAGMYQRREAGGRPDSRAFDDKSPRTRDKDRPERTSRPTGKPYPEREESDKPERKSYGRSTSSDRDSDRRPTRSRDGETPARPYVKREASDKPERKSYGRNSSASRDEDRRPAREGDSNTSSRPYRNREDSEKPARKTYSKDGGSSREDDRRPQVKRDGERTSRPYERRESSVKPRKGRSEGKFFRPGEDDTTEKRKRIGQDDNYKRSEPGKFEKPTRDEGDKKWNRKESHELYGDRKKNVPTFSKKEKPEAAIADSEDGTRLNKFIANAGICSRREADEMIKVGVISVNGEIITEMGYKVQHGDVVKYNNETLRGERLVYILLNKPKDFITTTDDPEERKTVMNLIAKACKERVYPVGRLDRNTTGVLLFTNDGDIARKLTHPSFEVHKIYQVELDKALNKEDMEAITNGITLDDGFIKVDEIAYATEARDVVGVEIHSGRNRIVRRIFEHLEYKVKKLDRVVFAGLTKKDLPRGRWRFLTDLEVANLKMITGKKQKVR